MNPVLATLLFAVAGCAWIGADTTLRCADCRLVQVTHVVDGDTFQAGLLTVRLFGVDTPERGERCASEATERLHELAGDTVRLEDGPRLTDQFGRRLAYVYTQDGVSVDAALIREGLAKAWTRDGQYRDYLVRLEREARGQKAGCLW